MAEVLWAIWNGTEWPDRLWEAALAESRGTSQNPDAAVGLFKFAGRRQELAGYHGVDAFCSAMVREEIPTDTGCELSIQGRDVRFPTAHRSRTDSW